LRDWRKLGESHLFTVGGELVAHILFSSNQHSRSTTALDYLFMRTTGRGLDIDFGRDKKPINQTRLKEGYISATSRFIAI